MEVIIWINNRIITGRTRSIVGFLSITNNISKRPKPKPKNRDKKISSESFPVFLRNKSNKKYRKINFVASSRKTLKKR